jgi:hypothetical protein
MSAYKDVNKTTAKCATTIGGGAGWFSGGFGTYWGAGIVAEGGIATRNPNQYYWGNAGTF